MLQKCCSVWLRGSMTIFPSVQLPPYTSERHLTENKKVVEWFRANQEIPSVKKWSDPTRLDSFGWFWQGFGGDTPYPCGICFQNTNNVEYHVGSLLDGAGSISRRNYDLYVTRASCVQSGRNVAFWRAESPENPVLMESEPREAMWFGRVLRFQNLTG